ncbi:LuxR C-terminal-related transcriptional regulator [Curtobacterium flaccumfaciens]|uniref:helix-turn-helix transcriptional regulator n=1 Tax=Curtobacterium flaccumfaciens TaxID=2035 RepID=UPI003EBEB818
MSISIPDARTMRGTLHDDDVFRRAIHAPSSTTDRFVVIEGPRGSGKSHALASIAAAARADGHGVVELRSSGGDPVIAASSLGQWVSLVQDVEAHRTARTVVLMDDFHALAESARSTLQTVFTGLVHETDVVCVVAVEDRRSVPGWIDLQYVPLRPLDDDAAEELLRRDRVDLPATRIAMLLRLAEGNPFLLHAIGAAWSSAPATDRAAFFPTSYPRLGPTTDAAAHLLDGLADGAREAALVLAVASVEFPDDVAWDGQAVPVLDAALRPLVVEGASGPAFRDPFVRVHLLATTPPAELRRIRLLVAASTGVPERLRVLAEASASPVHDDSLVPRLIALVDESFRLRRPDDAATALLEAARLTSSDTHRARLRARAAAIGAFTGDFGLVDAEAERAALRDEPQERALVGAREFVRALRTGDVRAGKRAVLTALEGPDAGDDDVLVVALFVLCWLRGDGSWWDEALAITAERDLDPVLRLVEDCLEPDRPEADRDAMYRDARISAADAQPWKAVALHVAWTLLDATDPRRELVDAMLRRSGNDGLLGYFTTSREAVTAYQAGRLTTASRAFEQVRERAEQWGAGTLVALAEALQALIHSLQGESEAATEKADSATRWALQHGAPLVARAADHARSSLEVATGRFEEAYARSATRPPAVGRWLENSYGPIELLDAVESAARLRLTDHGVSLVVAAERAQGAQTTPRRSMILKAARAVLDTGADARSLFEEALATVESEDAPFEVARVRLAYGDWLRRSMHALEARTQFRLAASTFEILGAARWRTRAEGELRVAGGAGVPFATDPSVELSEQEHRVASLAAAGFTNKQIANQLYLSPRTVSGHLYRLFPKLGVTTRAGLRDALLGLGAER